MAKNTDYKKMYKKVKEENVALHNENQRLNGINKGYQDLLNNIKAGKVKGITVSDEIKEADTPILEQ